MSTSAEPAAREPCPCGSGRRYKACHGKAAARAAHTRVVRPLQGLADEPEWVAMRDIVPAATAGLVPIGEYADRSVTLCSVLPMAWPALVRQDGSVMLASQTQTSSPDAARDLGDALDQALRSPPGTSIPPRPLPSDAPRIQDLVEADAPLHVMVHARFDFWFDEVEELDAASQASLERANTGVMPTARLATVSAAYWMQLGDRRQLRWVLPGGEDEIVDALARMQADGGLQVGTQSRYLGAFRSLGLLVPVWDLEDDVEVDAIEDPAVEFLARLTAASTHSAPLSGVERRARESLLARQLTMN